MAPEVTSVEAYAFSAPPSEPFGYSQEWVTDRSALLVRVAASDGTVGGGCW